MHARDLRDVAEHLRSALIEKIRPLDGYHRGEDIGQLPRGVPEVGSRFHRADEPNLPSEIIRQLHIHTTHVPQLSLNHRAGVFVWG